MARAWRPRSAVTAVTFRQVSHCWEASGDCCFSSRDGLKISLHILNSSSWWSLLKTELRWKAVMQMCHITVALSLCIFVWYGGSTAINFRCSLYYCRVVTWSIYYFICFMPSEISLNLSLEMLFSSEERVYLHKLLSSNSMFSAGVDYMHKNLLMSLWDWRQMLGKEQICSLPSVGCRKAKEIKLPFLCHSSACSMNPHWPKKPLKPTKPPPLQYCEVVQYFWCTSRAWFRNEELPPAMILLDSF